MKSQYIRILVSLNFWTKNEFEDSVQHQITVHVCFETQDTTLGHNWACICMYPDLLIKSRKSMISQPHENLFCLLPYMLSLKLKATKGIDPNLQSYCWFVGNRAWCPSASIQQCFRFPTKMVGCWNTIKSVQNRVLMTYDR